MFSDYCYEINCGFIAAKEPFGKGKAYLFTVLVVQF